VVERLKEENKTEFKPQYCKKKKKKKERKRGDQEKEWEKGKGEVNVIRVHYVYV
jgi:hypothetical protein